VILPTNYIALKMPISKFDATNQDRPNTEWNHMAPTAVSGILCGMVLSSTQDMNPATLRVSLACEALPVEAFVAAACLLQPELGDQVLLYRAQQMGDLAQANTWWILSVLQRGQPATAAKLSVPGAEAVTLQAPQLSLHTERLQVLATTAHVVARQLTRVARVFHAMGDIVTEQCRTKAVMVAELNSTQAGTELLESKDALLLKGAQVMLDAQHTVRIDGEHILMG
jgi:hypothetical protein